MFHQLQHHNHFVCSRQNTIIVNVLQELMLEMPPSATIPTNTTTSRQAIDAFLN